MLVCHAPFRTQPHGSRLQGGVPRVEMPVILPLRHPDPPPDYQVNDDKFYDERCHPPYYLATDDDSSHPLPPFGVVEKATMSRTALSCLAGTWLRK